MASYLITGASRGIGFEFLNQLSSDPQNTVIGLVRDKATTESKVKAEFGARQNVHIIQADITDYVALRYESVTQVATITGGKLDYIIANAALVSAWSGYDALGTLGSSHTELEQDLLDSFKVNVIGNIHLINLYMPLVLKGAAKKVIAISSGMADPDLVNSFEIHIAAPYTISKAALNLAIAKFNAQYKREGVLFMSISPGFVDTGSPDKLTKEQTVQGAELGAKFAQYAPSFTGPISPQSSVESVLSVIRNSSVKKGFGGAFVSHFGNKQWL